MTTSRPTIIIIVGITGDLSRRYLLPSLEKVARAGALPEKLRIVGVTRQDISASQVLDGVKGSTAFLQETLDMCQVDLAKREDYEKLKSHLAEIEAELGGAAQRLYYLSIPPQASQPVVRLLGESGLSKVKNTKLLLEKPFGVDLGSAEELLAHTEQYFSEEQVYRIDHYLAKEMAQNLLVFRDANPLLKHTWNRDCIERIEVVAYEAIDIEGRGGFYEQTGALRDVMQSHVLQLAALTLMEPSAIGVADIPEKRLAALRQLHIPGDRPIPEVVIRGQYEGYRREVENNDSTVETYVRLDLVSSDPRWEGVPIRLATGKALSVRKTAITITYRSDSGLEPNQLVLQVQPDTGIEFRLWAKAPGYEHKLVQHPLKFTYGDHYDELPDAYEQVLLDAINSNHKLFTSGEEVRESWRILEPAQEYWGMHDGDLRFYAKGSDGPSISPDIGVK